MNDKQVRTFLNAHRPADIPDIWERIQNVPLPSPVKQAVRSAALPHIIRVVTACMVLSIVSIFVCKHIPQESFPFSSQNHPHWSSSAGAESSVAGSSVAGDFSTIQINAGYAIHYKLGGILREVSKADWEYGTVFPVSFLDYDLSYQILYTDESASASQIGKLLNGKRDHAWFSICYFLDTEKNWTDDWPSDAKCSKILGTDVLLTQYQDHFYASFTLNGHSVLIETCDMTENAFITLVQNVIRS